MMAHYSSASRAEGTRTSLTSPGSKAESVVGAFAGTFIGAGVATVLEGRSLVEAGTVGWGAILGRSLAVALKGAAGIVILTVTTLALFF